MLKTILVWFTSSLCFYSCHKDHNVTPVSATGRQTYTLNISYGGDADSTATVYLTIYINGVPVEVAFDTGSSGLRVLDGALTATTIAAQTQTVNYSYGDGTPQDNLGIKGVVAQCNFTLDPAIPAVSIPFMLIQSAEFNEGNYNSTANQTTLGGAYRSKSGLLAVGMRLYNNNYGIGSPLGQLAGGGRFMIQLPHYPGKKGQLIINPDASDVAGFQMIQLDSMTYHLPNGYKSWWDDSIPGNIWINGVKYPQQGTLLDIGNPVTWIHNSVFKYRDYIGADTAVRLQLKGGALADTSFIAGKYSGLNWVETDSGTAANSFGIQFFFDYDVLYDQQHGLIGIRKK